MKNALRLIPLILIVLIVAACSAVPPVAGDGQASNILFQDDFSDQESGWDQAMGYDGLTNYTEDGFYRIFVNDVNKDIWANPGQHFSDVRVEVDATKIGGPDQNDFGVICRFNDSANFYFFIISSQGHYAIGKLQDGVQTMLVSNPDGGSEHVKLGSETNRIRGDCVGSTLSLHVNNQKLLETQDISYTQGDVGLIAGAFDVAGTDIHFDNFVVLKP